MKLSWKQHTDPWETIAWTLRLTHTGVQIPTVFVRLFKLKNRKRITATARWYKTRSTVYSAHFSDRTSVRSASLAVLRWLKHMGFKSGRKAH